MQYDVRIEQSEAAPLAVVRRRAKQVELGKVVPECCGLVWQALRAQKIAGAGRHIAIYFDDVINLEVGVELESPFAGDGEVVGSNTPAGEVATTTHVGPYATLHAAHSAIQKWCASNARTLAGPTWEVYDHWQNEWNSDPSRIRTDVYYLLATP
jgi:effector-binding domain-containing protein